MIGRPEDQAPPTTGSGGKGGLFEALATGKAAEKFLGRRLSAKLGNGWPPTLYANDTGGHLPKFDERFKVHYPAVELTQEDTHARLTTHYRTGLLCVQGPLSVCMRGARWEGGWRELQLELAGTAPAPASGRLTGGLTLTLSHSEPDAASSTPPITGDVARHLSPEACGLALNFMPRLMTVWGEDNRTPHGQSELKKRHVPMNLKWGDRLRLLINHRGWCDVLGRSDATGEWVELVSFQSQLGLAPVFAVIGLQHTAAVTLTRVYTGIAASSQASP